MIKAEMAWTFYPQKLNTWNTSRHSHILVLELYSIKN